MWPGDGPPPPLGLTSFPSNRARFHTWSPCRPGLRMCTAAGVRGHPDRTGPPTDLLEQACSSLFIVFASAVRGADVCVIGAMLQALNVVKIASEILAESAVIS